MRENVEEGMRKNVPATYIFPEVVEFDFQEDGNSFEFYPISQSYAAIQRFEGTEVALSNVVASIGGRLVYRMRSHPVSLQKVYPG